MSRARERAAAPSAGVGWLVTIGGAVILLAFGFGIGLVAGSALEEPELVAKHLAGEATELPLPAAVKPPPAQEPATKPAPPAPRAAEVAPTPVERPAGAPPATPTAPKPPAERTAAQAPPAAPTPKPVATPRPPAPAPAVAARPAGFAIQVGAFAERKAAEELVSSLRGDRLRAYVVEGAPSESARFRVRVGPYTTREQAGDEAARIKAKRRLPIWVIAEGGHLKAASAGRSWLVLGAAGQLGSALVARLGERGIPCEARDSRLDVGDAAALRRALGPLRPATVLNAAAYTDVDGCERDPARADAVNAKAPAALAALCAELESRLLHVSTDYVFDGRARTPLDEDAPVAPLSTYGRSKLDGERAVLAASPGFVVVRTSWVFGRGKNFIAAIRGRAEAIRRDPALGPLRVVDDQVGSPTYAEDLAGGLLDLLDRGGRGLYHLANRGVASRLELARFALAVLDERDGPENGAGLADLEIQPVKTVDFPLPAERPLYTVLDCARARAAGVELRPWQDAVRAYLDAPAAPRRAANGS